MFEFILFTFLFQTHYNTIKEYELVYGRECPFTMKQINDIGIVPEIHQGLIRKQKRLIAITCRTKKHILEYGVK
jgi:hypothetical protein